MGRRFTQSFVQTGIVFLLSLVAISNHLLAQSDNYCGAATITPSTSCNPQAGSTAGFTNDPQYSSSCPGNENDEGWYEITGGTPGNEYTVQVQGTGGTDMVISVVASDGAACSPNSELGCSDDTGNNGTETVTFTWTNNWDHYYVQIYNYTSNGGGTFNICVVDEGASPCGGGESDCSGATVLCSNGPVAFNPCGPGANDFPTGNDGCLTGEHQSSWYYFEINSNAPANTILQFTLTPTDNTDYDFAIFGPNVNCGTGLGAPIRCSYADGFCTFCPSTGMGMGQTDNSENAGGNGFVAPLTVQPGQGFYMLIDNFDNSSMAFSLTWGGSAAPYLNCNPDCNLAATAVASPTTVCTGESSNLSVNVTGATGTPTYAWSGGLGSSATVTVMPTMTTTYTVTVTDGDCTTTSTVTVTVGAGLPATATTVNNTACTAPFTGSVNLTTTGTIFMWSNGASTEDLTGVAPGTYTVTVSNASGCTTVTSATVTNNPILPTASIAPTTNTACDPALFNGNVNLTTNGVSYIWSNNATTEDLTGVGPGTYTVTVTAVNGCTTVTSTTVTNSPLLPTASIAPTTNTACDPALFNGNVNMTTNGVSYMWSNNATTEDLTGVGPGTYTVTVTGANGCTTSTSSTVTNSPILPTASITPTPNTSCDPAAFNGNINLTTNAVSYVWNNNETTEDLTGVAPGTYTVTVTAANGCTTSTSSTVANNVILPTASIAPTPNTACDPALFNGNLNLTTNGVSYLWSNGETTEDLTGVAPGTYTVTVTAANGCTTTTNNTIANNPVLPTASIASTPNTACDPASFNGNINLTTNGISYLWSNGETTEDLTGVAPGPYTVTVTAANGCTTTTNNTIANTPILPTASIAPTPNTTCDPAQFNGNINLTTNGVSYLWSNGETTEDLTGVAPGPYTVTVTAANGCTTTTNTTVANNPILPTASIAPTPNTACDPAQFNGNINLTTNGVSYLWSNGETTEDLTAVAPGTYTVTVTAANGCTTTTNNTIANNPVLPTASITSTPNTICDPAQFNGNINLTTNGVSYIWSNGETTEDLTGVAPGLYTVTVTAANGCTTSTSNTIANNPPVITATATSTPNTTCVSGLYDGTINLTTTGTSYSWSNGETTEDLSGLSNGTYTVTVTGAGGCTTVTSATVGSLVALPTATLTQTPNTVCDPTLFNGSVTLTTNALSYSWSNGETTQNLTNTGPGTYTVTVTAANGCTTSTSIVVANNPVLPTASIAPTPNTACDPALYNGAINLTTNAVSYLWNNGETTQNLTNTAPGPYTVTVTAANGCTTSTSTTINNTPILPTVSTALVANTACDPALYNGSINLTSNGATYLWSNGETTQDLANLGSGTYTVVVTGANGCTTSTSVTIGNNPPTITATTSTTPNNSCIFGSYTGAVNLTTSGTSYLWSNGETTQDLTDVPNGPYTVTITGAGGCTRTATATVSNQVTQPNAVASTTPNTGCFPAYYNGTITLGTNGVDFFWSNGSTDQNLTNVGSGSYTVTVTGSNGCTRVVSANVGNNLDYPNPGISGESAICAGEDITLFATGGGTYEWSDGGGNDQIATYVNVSSYAVYTVTVTGTNGCTAVTDFGVDVALQPSLSIISVNCAPSFTTYSITFSASNGVVTTSAGTLSGNTITGIPISVSQVTVTITSPINSNCSVSVPVTAPNCSCPSIPPPTGNSLEICQGVSIPTLTASVGPGLQVNWFTTPTGGTPILSNSLTYTPTASGTWYAQAIDPATGCVSNTRKAISLTIRPLPVGNISGPTAVCAGVDLVLNATGGNSYQWSNGGGTAPSATYGSVSTSTTYTVTVTDAYSCTDEASFAVVVTPQPTLAIVDVTCSTDLQSYSITFSATGGDVTATAGTISGNTVTNIPASVATVTLTATSTANTTCVASASVNAPNCNCPSIPAPTGAGAEICEDAPIPTLTVNAGAGLQVNWFIVPTGGSPIVTNSNTYTPASAGTYYTEAYDPTTGCVSAVRTPITLTIHLLPIGNISGTANICSGTDISLTASGGVDYLWSNGGGNGAVADFTNVTATTTYTVTVSSVNGCTDVASFTVTVAEQPTLAIVNVACAPDLQTYNVTFIATGGAITATSGTISGNILTAIPVTVPSVTLTVINPSNNTCVATASVNTPNCNCPTIPPPVGNNEVICQNEPILPLIVTVGAGLQVNWYTSATGGLPILNNSTSYLPTMAGTYYTESLEPTTGCLSNIRTPVTLTIHPLPVANIAGNNAICAGSDVVLDATGGNGYSWSNSGGSNASATYANVIATTTYTVTVSDANGCTDDASFTVNVSLMPTLVITNVSCAPDLLTYNVTFNATGGTITTTAGTLSGNTVTGIPIATTSVTITVTSPTNSSCTVTASANAPNCNCPTVPPPTGQNEEICQGESIPVLTAIAQAGLQINWYNAPSGGSPVQSNSTTYLPSIAGTYFAETIDPATGCVSATRTPLTLTIHPTPTANISGNDQICAGTDVTLTATGGDSYLWSGSGGMNASATFTNLTVTTTYSVTVSTVNGCTDEVDFTVNVAPQPTIAVTNVICAVDLLSYDVTFVSTNGSVVTTAGTIVGNSVVNIPVTVPSVTLTVTNSVNNACVATASVNTPNCNCPTIPPPMGNNAAICQGATIPALVVSVATGLQVNWYTTATGGAPILINNTSFQPVAAGTWYTESLDPATGCFSNTRTPVTLTIHPLPMADISGPANICAGSSATLTAIGGGNYLWSSGGGTAANATFNNIQTNTTYTVTVTDANGCTDNATFTVNVTPIPTLTVTLVECAPDQQSYSISFTATGGVVTSSIGPIVGNTISGIPISTSSVVLTVTSTSNSNCLTTQTVSAPNCQCPPVPAPIGINAAICPGATIPTLTVTAATGLQVNWYTTATGGAPIATNSLGFTPTTTGTWYAETLNPITNCVSDTRTAVTLSNHPVPVASITGTAAVCSSADATLVASGGTTYQWSGGGNTATITYPDITAASTFTVTVSNAQGCTDTESFTININKLTASASSTDPLCYDVDNGSIVISPASGGTGAYSYYLDGTLLSGTVATDLGPGTYEILIEDEAGCTFDSTIIIHQAPWWSLNLAVDQTRILVGQPIQLSATTNLPPAQIASISWDPSYNMSCTDCLNPVVTPILSTVYSITLEDLNGCKQSATAGVVVDLIDKIVFPNVINPGADGVNSWFFPSSDPAQYPTVDELRIFDRWGNLVFINRNFATNDATKGWDGTFEGTPMNPAVFVYVAIVTRSDNERFVFSGDVTVVR